MRMMCMLCPTNAEDTSENSFVGVYQKLIDHIDKEHPTALRYKQEMLKIITDTPGDIEYKQDSVKRAEQRGEEKMAKKKGFGVEVSFKGDSMTLEQLFGSKPILSTQMSKIIWDHIKAKQFEEQKDWKPAVGEKVKFQWSKDKRWYPATLQKISGGNFQVEEDGTGEKHTVSRKQLLKR